MSERFQQSLVQRTGLALAAVILLAIVNMVASYLTAESSENDAVRINLAGSLRMQAHRIANQYILVHTSASLGNRAALEEAVAGFEARLERPVLAEHLRISSNPAIASAFMQVRQEWYSLKSIILAGNAPTQQVLRQVGQFVDGIDAMVKLLELQTEKKFQVLRLIQGICLLLTVGLAGVMFYHVYKYVVGPLNQLVGMAGRLRAGDFSQRLDSRNDDELALLANTLNDMADSLDGMYRTLEDQVESKTRHLEETQKMLRFLYDTSRRLSAEGRITSKLEMTLDHLCREIEIAGGIIELHHASPSNPFRIASSAGQPASPQAGSTFDKAADGESSRKYSLQHDNTDYGCLTIISAGHGGISGEQHLMLTALADTIGAALANESRKDQAHRVALMEERNAIARELHDSIAQSLSFTKIQVSRLQSLLDMAAPAGESAGVLGEIRTGIQSAYAQLRELLATFRLQLDSPGLQASLAATTREFEHAGQLSITLQSSLQNYPLTPNEEIHILQIVREALSNVLRHSGADRAWIRLEQEQESGMIKVQISDNGSGFDQSGPALNHYGQGIMRERAGILGGDMEFANLPEGGAQVVLRFRAEHASSSGANAPAKTAIKRGSS